MANDFEERDCDGCGSPSLQGAVRKASLHVVAVPTAAKTVRRAVTVAVPPRDRDDNTNTLPKRQEDDDDDDEMTSSEGENRPSAAGVVVGAAVTCVHFAPDATNALEDRLCPLPRLSWWQRFVDGAERTTTRRNEERRDHRSAHDDDDHD